MHYLDEGWTVIITSDHAQVAPNWAPPGIGDMCGVNADLMEELGYTVLKDDPKDLFKELEDQIQKNNLNKIKELYYKYKEKINH